MSVVLVILKAGILVLELQLYSIGGTITMLGNDELGEVRQVLVVLTLEYLIVLRTVDKAYHIGILLNGTRLTKVGKLGTLALVTLTVLYTTI